MTQDITILADVVDNFGDIGVAWRLCRHLLMSASQTPAIKIRLVTNNLKSFHNINSQIDLNLPFQNCACENGFVEVYDWTNYDFCYKTFTENPPVIILELFQCGQPEWLEKILFEDRVDHIVNIIMIDYLSAEKWVDDFHCLKSLTRTALVPKVNFMPGFSPKTGGILLSPEMNSSALSQENKNVLNSLFFAYERDWSPVIKAMNRVFTENTILKVAGGAGQESIIEACRKENAIFKTEELSFMDQENWDQMMRESDFLIIRGEDSMAQACCLGIPFIWQAYPQKEDYQSVKVEALLDKMRSFFGPEFSLVECAWKEMNNYESNQNELEKTVFDFLSNINEIKNGFRKFSESLYKNGDLADNLMTFISKSIKIE